MKPIDRNRRIERSVVERQMPDVPLGKGDVPNAECLRTRTRRRKHRGCVVETGDVRLRELRIDGQRETSRPDRYLEQPPRKALVCRTQRKRHITAHAAAIQPPHEP